MMNLTKKILKKCLLKRIIMFFLYFSLSIYFYSEDNIIFVEGENAIVTNFAKEPTFNFSCSNILALQLIERKEVEGELKYFADYIIDVNADGIYMLWIAGTPPGPVSHNLPSYFSPIQLQLDNDKAVNIYFEDVSVKEKYASSFYWTKISKINLKKGHHRIRFIVKNRRNFDNLYYFNLDAFLLIRMNDQNQYIFPEKIPDFFPKNLMSANNITFKSSDTYLTMLKDMPNNKETLDSLAEIYTLTYQYNDAIKYLKLASLIDPGNINIKRLIAQNYIWKGDYNSGIKEYSSILKEKPDNSSLYIEIAKIAAWSGALNDSIKLYQDAIKIFPDNLDFQINLALTYYWNSQADKADSILENIKWKGLKNPLLLSEAGDIFKRNRYFDDAVSFYNKAIDLKIKNPDTYIKCAELYYIRGGKTEADNVLKKMRSVYENENDYQKTVDGFINKMSSNIEFTGLLEKKLSDNPDDINTRYVLAQTFTWYNQNEKAIDEYLKIIENEAFIKIENMEEENIFLTNALAINVLNKKLLIKQFTEYSENLAGIDKDFLNISKMQKDTDDYKKELEKIGKKINDSKKLINLFNKISENIEKKNLTVNEIFQKRKSMHEIYKTEIKNLKWKPDVKEFSKSFEYLYRTGNSYLSAKIIGLSLFYNDDIKYKDYFYKLNTDFNKYDKTKYENFINLSLNDSGLIDISSYLDKNIFNIVSYNPDIQNIYDEMKSYEEIISSPNDLTNKDPDYLKDNWENMKKETAQLADLLKKQNSVLEENFNIIKNFLKEELYIKILEFEKDSVLIRTELGELYSKMKDFKNAEVQFTRILKVDKENSNVKFSLARTYQLNKEWYKAMKLYDEVFRNDPRNTLAASLYNELADQNPLTISSTTKLYSEGKLDREVKNYSQSLEYISETAESHLFINQNISFDFALTVNNRTNKTYIGYNNNNIISLFPITYRYNYFLLKTVFNFDIPNTGLVLSPSIGLEHYNTFTVQSDRTDTLLDENKRDDFLENDISYNNKVVFYPYINLKLEWNKIPYFNFNFAYTFQLFEDSMIPWINGYYFSYYNYLDAGKYGQVYTTTHNLKLYLNYNFNFAKVYPFTKITFTTSGEIEFYAMSNIQNVFNMANPPFKYTLSQDLNFNFAEIKKAGLFFFLYGLVVYEGSDKDFDSDYKEDYYKTEIKNNVSRSKYFNIVYTPHQNLSAKGGLILKLDAGTFSKVPVTYSIIALAGAQWQDLILKTQDLITEQTIGKRSVINPFILLNINNVFELWLKRFILVFEFNYSLSYDLSIGDDINHFQSFDCQLYMKVPIHKRLSFSN